MPRGRGVSTVPPPKWMPHVGRRLVCSTPGREDGHRVRTCMASNLSRFVRRQRAPARVRYVVRLKPGETTRAWRSLLNSLRGLTPKECQYEADAARDVARQRSQDGGEPVASKWLESPDSGPRPLGQELPPIFRQLLSEIGADDSGKATASEITRLCATRTGCFAQTIQEKPRPPRLPGSARRGQAATRPLCDSAAARLAH
jgi:hypothetical protein